MESKPVNSEFDYIVVGAGSAGCVLARRLTENPSTRVLVLEAGGPDRDPNIHIPLTVGRMWRARMHDWGYDTDPEPNLNNREIEMMRGKVLGGCSAINAMAHIRGHPADYDRWAKRPGLEAWSYASSLPYFKKAENWAGPPQPYRGDSGPIHVRFSNPGHDPISQALIEAGKAAGHATTDDINGPTPAGFGFSQSAIHQGRRCSAAVGYLKPVLQRPNLTVTMNVLATRILIEGKRAVGIEYIEHGQAKQARASREVLLAGGAINSPQLLMLSGIGDGDALKAHGIASVAHLPGVGANFQDHLGVEIFHERKGTSPLQHLMRFDRIVPALAMSYFGHESGASRLPGGVTAMLYSDEPGAHCSGAPDIHLLFRGASMAARPWFGINPPWKDAFSLRAVLVHPKSRGKITLRSTDPREHVRIQGGFLSDTDDLRSLVKAAKLVRDVLHQKAMDSFRGKELSPGPDQTDDAAIERHIRATSITAHHPSCTCPMGMDALAVVDPELRVHGVEALRVVDASAMPDLTSANIHAAVLLIAERAADLIRGRVPAQPNDETPAEAQTA
jgi:4-pyridoxate dehydrogenase